MMDSTPEHGKPHITIGSVPQTKTVKNTAQIDLQNDLQMVKAALLYADKAKLYSIASSTLLSIATLDEIPNMKRWDFLQTLRSLGVVDESTEQMMALLSKVYEEAIRKRYSKKGSALLRQFNKGLAESWDDMTEYASSIVSGMGGDGIIQAVDSGLLEVHAFKSVLERTVQESKHKDFVLEYVGAVSEAISDGHTYPLFDEDTSEIISAGIAAGLIPVSDSTVVRGKEIGLAADLFGRLPLFPQATVKEILDIRRELDTPLHRFRAAMIMFSRNIKNAAWDQDFPSDAEQVFRRDVAPTIVTLEEEVRSNTFLSKLFSEFADKSLEVGGSVTASATLSALAVRMLNLPLTDVAALAIGPMLAVGGTAYNAYLKWKEQQRSAEQNNLFFYYRAGTLLHDGTFEYVNDR
jgi:hypothetical protein